MSESDPEVSIVLPTYNRAASLERAVDSVLAQRFDDYELIIVDDGSTDETLDFDAGRDARIRFVRQENRGASAARNHGLELTRGRFITFLDSDDEWFPNALGLEAAFLREHPDVEWVNTDFVNQFDDRPDMVRTIRDELVPRARAIGSSALDLPVGETDDLLRIYETSEPVGDWAAPWLDENEIDSVRRYHGHIFDKMRWGHLTWLPTLMMTRRGRDAAGRFPEDQKNAVDYAYMGRLARAFPGSFISAVVAQKNDTAPGGEMIDHLATAQTGGTTYSLHVNQLRGFDELFGGLDDPELAVVRRRHEYEAGLAAVRGGKRSEALEHFGSVAAFDRHFWKAHVLRALVFAAGSGERAARIHEGATSGLRSLRDRVRPG